MTKRRIKCAGIHIEAMAEQLAFGFFSVSRGVKISLSPKESQSPFGGVEHMIQIAADQRPSTAWHCLL
jgi:hypothetical protein